MTAQVEINDITPRTQSIASGGQTVFDTDWTADVESDILVYARADGVAPDDETQFVDSSLYNVTFIGGDRIVRVTFLSGRTADDIITIIRDTPADRTNLYTNTNFTPSMLNQDFGILTLVDQQAKMYNDVINIRYNASYTPTDPNNPEIDTVLPILGANQIWMMASDLSGIIPVELPEIPPSENAPFVVYEASPSTPEAFNLGTLTTGLLKITVAAASATPSTAVLNSDYYGPGMNPLPIAEGGTGAGTAAGARTNLGLGTIATQDADNVAITGGSVDIDSGSVVDAPVAATDLVNKAYADAIAAGFNFINPVNAASTADFASTYDNGASGVGATLTADANGAFSLDGEAGVLNNRYLIKNQATTFENGIYTLTQVGDGSNPAILTRSTDFDEPSEIQPGDLVPVLAGTANALSTWVQTATVATIGSDAITFIQFGISPANIVTITGTQTITGDKTFSAPTEFDSIFFSDNTLGILGTDTNDSADAGYVGELISSTVQSGSAVSLSASVAANITSISLTEGDWDVCGEVWISATNVVSMTTCSGSISTTSATDPAQPAVGTSYTQIRGISCITNEALLLPQKTARITVANGATTTVYLIGLAVYTGTSVIAFGSILARRRR